MQLASFGKTIIVGRGSNVITSKLPNCFHIRLVAPIENRINHVQDVFKYSKTEAMDYIKKEDENRRKYLKSHFYKEPEDPSLYHLILNTGKFNYDETAEMISDIIIKRFSKSFD